MARVLFHGGQVFDGTGAPPAPGDVLVQDGRIVAVGAGLDGDEVVDCTGRGLLPGMFDCHVHLICGPYDPVAEMYDPFSLQFYKAAINMRATLAAGITTVRDACGADLGIQVAQQRGMIPGPRMQISIAMISQTGGHGDFWDPSGCELAGVFSPHPGRPPGVADGPDAVRAKVREMIRAGANVIKIATSGGVLSPRSDPRRPHFRDAEVAAVCEEAAAAGIAVMSHANSAEGIKVAIRNGVRSVEHGAFLDDEAIAMMLERGTWLVPTLLAPRGVFETIEHNAQVPPYVIDKARIVMEGHYASARRAIEAGVRIAFGTDTGVTAHGRNLEELELLVESGMTPAQALHAATGSAAELMGLDAELGTLEEGKRADLVIVNGDPLDVTALASRITAVYQDGILVHPGLSGAIP
jgi:imidazolonepropionase-like amidohydrolase